MGQNLPETPFFQQQAVNPLSFLKREHDMWLDHLDTSLLQRLYGMLEISDFRVDLKWRGSSGIGKVLYVMLNEEEMFKLIKYFPFEKTYWNGSAIRKNIHRSFPKSKVATDFRQWRIGDKKNFDNFCNNFEGINLKVRKNFCTYHYYTTIEVDTERIDQYKAKKSIEESKAY